MGKYKIKDIDNNIEKRILIYLIVSDKFINDLISIIDPIYFTIPYIQTIVNWVIDYYDMYEIAPKLDIKPIFEKEQIRLEEKEVELIERILLNVSEIYETNEVLNLDYVKNRALEYFRKRELEITSGNAKHYLEQDDIISAENELLKYKQVALATTQCIDVFNEEIIIEAFKETEESLLHIPGYLGMFLGPLQRGWLVGLEGGYKKGKTWWLLEYAVCALMDGLNVAFFSLEMSKNEIIKRLYHRLLGMPKEDGDYLFPVFDCQYNQDGSCVRPERESPISLLDEDGEKPEFNDAPNYRPCTYCRNDGTDTFKTAIWYENKICSKLTATKAVNRANAFTRIYGKKFKLKAYPRFSANVRDIKHDLDILESADDFIPDVIIIDYADILKPESSNNAGVQKEDETWIALAQCAGERNSLVITPTQISKSGQDAETIQIQHTARWSGKLGHVDMMIGINQTDEEKTTGVQRINVILHRHNDFDPNAQCIILQNFSIGAVHLDSEKHINYQSEE